jgi:2-amino-4-ketopentanoate thiolase alpha subunit
MMTGIGKEEATAGMQVRISRVLLKPEERSGRLPGATGKVPLVMWTKGKLTAPPTARPGDEVQIESSCGRKERGTLVEIQPSWNHHFGKAVPELHQISEKLRCRLRREKNHG